MGAEGEANPRVQYALAQLEQARLDLAKTQIRAHTPGYIGSLYIDEGAYATAGQPVTTFIALNDFWIEAYMTENNLGRVKPGDKVEIAFDAFPGKIFHGKVKKTAPGVSTGKKTDLGGFIHGQEERQLAEIGATVFGDHRDHGLRDLHGTRLRFASQFPGRRYHLHR